MCKLNMFQKSTEIYQSLKIQERETQGDVLHHTNHFLFYELLQNKWKTDSVEYYSQNCQTVVFQTDFVA